MQKLPLQWFLSSPAFPISFVFAILSKVFWLKNVNKAAHAIIKKDFKHSKTAKVEVKGKGVMTSYFL